MEKAGQTRPNDRCKLSLHTTFDLYKAARYKSLWDLLAQLLLGWEVEIQKYTICVRGSHEQDIWYAQLQRLEVTTAREEWLIQDMVAQ